MRAIGELAAAKSSPHLPPQKLRLRRVLSHIVDQRFRDLEPAQLLRPSCRYAVNSELDSRQAACDYRRRFRVLNERNCSSGNVFKRILLRRLPG